MISILYHADLNQVQGPLAGLLSAQDAPFDRLAWWQGLAGDCGMAPLLAVASDDATGAMAVLALARAPRLLVALANWYSFRWRPIVTPGADGLALLTALARDLAHRSARITLAPLPDENGEAALLAAAFAAAGWRVIRENCDTNHVLEVGGRSYAQFLEARPGPLRTTLTRKARRLDVTILTSFDAGAWDIYEAIYRASWKPAEGSPAFLRRFAAAEGAAGRLRLGLAMADGAPVAAQMWTVESGIGFIHKLAHRRDADALSPGTVLSAALFRHVIDQDKVTLIDFGTGGDAYKADWMEGQRPRYRLDLLRPARPANWSILLRAALARRGRRG